MSKAPITELRDARLRKLEKLRELGVNPYPSTTNRTHRAGTIVSDYEAHEGRKVTVAGRIMSWRSHGALSFGRLQDPSGSIQLYMRRDTVENTRPEEGTLGYKQLKLFDVGDFAEATGEVTKTKRGEISVLVQRIRMLTKSLRPLPDKWSGLKDPELLLRRRYLDTTFDPDNRAPFEAVSRILHALRGFLHERGYVECLTPVIQPQYGGGNARPFRTYVNALSCNMYLAISHELYLKRMIAAGFEKVYTIGRYFRNEGIDRTHQPEFSMLETMTAFQDYRYNMDLLEQLFRHVAQEAFGKTVFTIRGHEIDFAKPFKRISMVKAVREATGIDFSSLSSLEEANQHLETLGFSEPAESIGEALVRVLEERVQETLIQPTLVYGHPAEVSPLAKPMDSDPRYSERFELFIAGLETSENWSEQNDPLRLLQTWKEKREAAGADDEEVQPLDYDFIEVLEYGMPPTTGLGPGIERMAMIFTDRDNIDDVVFFPMIRPRLSRDNAAIFGLSETDDASDEEDSAAERVKG